MSSLLRPVDQKGLLMWFVLAILLGFGIQTVYSFPLPLLAIFGLNVSTYLVMLIDKIQAVQSGRRLSERSLFLMTVLGGSIGMVTAMYTLRHKSRKTAFQLVVWVIVLLQLSMLYYLYSSLSPL